MTRATLNILCLCAGAIIGQTTDAEEPNHCSQRSISFKSIKEALDQPLDAYFWIGRNGEQYSTGHTESHYVNNTDRGGVTFDVSNHQILLNMHLNGTMQFADSRPTYRWDFIPGGWKRFDVRKSPPVHFALEMGGSNYNLNEVDWPFKTGYLGGFFPLTEYTHEGTVVRILSFAPISSDGNDRPRAAVYGIMLENNSERRIGGKIKVPDFSRKVCGGTDWLTQRFATMFRTDCETGKFDAEVPFELEPGQNVWVPYIVMPPGEDEGYEAVNPLGSLHWLNETWSFFDRMTGHIDMPDDPLTAAMLRRHIMFNFNTVAVDSSGGIAGVMFGSVIGDGSVNNLDSYYPFVPLSMFSPSVIKEAIPWFFEFGVRPVGHRFKDGVSHSLQNSLSSVMLAGLYYQHTGDKAYFLEHKFIKDEMVKLLDSVVESRHDKDIWLFPSRFLSDGYSLGDYHTGSNMAAWFAFKNGARILGDVYGDHEKAAYYLSVSEKIKACLDRLCVVDGSFGPQYNEGGNREGREPLFLMHDGEAMGPTLAPFYGYLSYDDSRYQNFNRFAMTPHNPAYCEATRGLVWEKYPAGHTPVGEHVANATFSGYITGLASCADREAMSGPDGRLTQIKRLTDLNGAFWWWPYHVGKGENVQRFYGSIAQSGFAEAGYVTLMVSEYIGVKYDAPSQSLSFRPFLVSDNFSWKGLRLGNSFFDISFRNQDGKIEATVKNLNNHAVNVRIELVPGKGQSLKSLWVNELPTEINQNGRFFDRKTVITTEKELEPGKTTMVRGASS